LKGNAAMASRRFPNSPITFWADTTTGAPHLLIGKGETVQFPYDNLYSVIIEAFDAFNPSNYSSGGFIVFPLSSNASRTKPLRRVMVIAM
jgi:hypothetical protein